MSKFIYCTYLTVYSGNKLPPFYIGSTTIQKVHDGYHGTVSSKKYKSIWISELKSNPNLFKTIVLTTHICREEATKKELYFQKKLNVVSSTMYINQSYASPKGFFTMNKIGDMNPMYGRSHSQETKEKISKTKLGKSMSEDFKLRTANRMLGNTIRKGKTMPDEAKEKIRQKMIGRYISEETRKKCSLINKGIKKKTTKCESCGKFVDAGNMKRWHSNGRCHRQ